LSTTNDEEPVAYLGGQAAEPDEPVEGYLGGDAPPDTLPALPPAGVSATYNASDFIPAPPEVTEDDPPLAEEAPPADETGPAYDTYAAEAPVAPEGAGAADFEQYGHAEEPQPETGTATVVEPPTGQDTASEFEEPGLPKTISQQDAENIIKRITTKKILPPDVAAADGRQVNPPSELTPRGGPKLGRAVFVLLIIFGVIAGAVAFKQDLEPYIPSWLAAILGVETAPPVVTNNEEHVETKEEILARKFRAKVLESEWRAFGFNSKEEWEASRREAVKTPGAPTGTGEEKKQ
jgi:hypothetical protein